MNTFDEIFIQLRPQLMSYANKMLRNWHDAEDFVGDAYIKAKMADEAGVIEHHTPESLHSYFKTVIYRLVCDRARKQRISVVSLDSSQVVNCPGSSGRDIVDSPIEVFVVAPDKTHKPIEDEELRGIVHDAVMMLPEHQRYAVIAHDMHEVPFAEVAKTLEICESTAKGRALRGRKRMEGKVKRYLDPRILQ